MCGLAGFVADGLDAAESRARVQRMTDCIVHRGPDGDGHWVERVDADAVALGFRRLAIVDLTPTGLQPMISASGRYVMCFNGEVYNHEELRPELERSGVAFRGTSDTEVMLALIERDGVRAALDAAVGMFGIALWDRRERRLTLVRDRMGEKPMYYGWQGDAFLFGSELKALRVFPGFDGRIDRNALAQLLRWQFVPAPATIYQGLHKLRAGELLELHIAPGSGRLRERARTALFRYWRVDDEVAAGLSKPFGGSLDEAMDALDATLSHAVRLQLRADVPLGAFLSGGIDSSLVVALMQKQAAHTVRTFSIGFDDPRFDESAAARRVAQHLNTQHTDLIVSAAEARAVIPSLPQMFDEPFADASQIPTYLVSKLARQHVTVSVSGDGGDELFGGYTKYAMGTRFATLPARLLLGRLLASPPARGLSHLAARVAAGTAGGGSRLATRLAPRRLARLAEMLASDPMALARNLGDNCPDVHVLVPGATGLPPPDGGVDAPGPGAPYGVSASLADQLGFLPEGVLVKVDRASMAVSLESRAPMLDHRVVRLASTFPWSMRGAAGNEKRVLRGLLYRYVPRALVDRPKMGFSMPIASWLRGELKGWAEALLHGAALRDDPYLDRAVVHARWSEHATGHADRSPMLWAVLMYLAWREQLA